MVRNLPQRWSHQWALLPDRDALTVLGDIPRRVSAAELSERTEVIAQEMAAVGVKAGDRVLWEAHAKLEAILSALSILRMGATLVPVAHFQSDLERQRVIDDVDPVMVVAPRRAGVGEGVAHRGAGELGGDREPILLDELSPDALAAIIYTSGTTGNPKGAMITHANLAAEADMLIPAWELSPDDKLLTALPLFHVHGLVVALMVSLAAGVHVVVAAKFDADSFSDAVNSESISVSYLVPTMIQRIGMAKRLPDFARLRLMVSGSAPLPVDQFNEVARESMQRIVERYGMTETLLTVSNPYRGERRPGTVGLPFTGVELELPEPGAEAELRVKSPTVFGGYWRRPEATAEVLVNGWMSSGDIVCVDEAGYVVVCGRSKDLIISGGFNVYPSEIEDLLRGRAGIEDVCIAGVASERWGEEVVAYVVGGAFSEQEAREQAAVLLSPYKRPQRYRRVASLPRNALGKLQRHLISEA